MSMHEAGWVLMFPDKTMFGITPVHENFIRTNSIKNAMIFNKRETTESVKERHNAYLADAKPMKLTYMLSEDY